jgi:hypothetical protein
LCEPGGRPGPGLAGLGAWAGRRVRARRVRKLRRTRAGVSRLGGADSPGPAEVFGQRSGEADLCVNGDDEPVPAVGGLRGPDLRCGVAVAVP